MAFTFSIVTPSLNQGKFIEQTICSVLSQEGDFFIDYIIMDGGSDDETLSIIRKYERLLLEKRWPIKCNGILYRWFSEPDGGQSHAINKGFALSRGEILAWLNSDDFYSLGALNNISESFQIYSTAGAFVGAGEMCDENGNRVFFAEPFEINVETLTGWIYRYFYQPSCFFTRVAWEKCGPLNEWLEYAMDLDLWMKICKSYEFIPITTMLSTSQKHDNAKTTFFWDLTAMEVAIVIASHGGGEKVRSDYAKFLSEKAHHNKLQNIQLVNSRSFKITYPLRLIASLYRKLRQVLGKT